MLRAAESRGATRAGGRTLATLVVGQVALTFVLLVGAGLCTASLRHALAARIGYDADQVLLVQLGTGANTGAAAQRALYADARARLATMPGVEGVAQTLMPPLRGVNGVRLRVPGWDSVPAMPGGGPYLNVVTPNYFAASGTRLLTGRAPAARAPSPDDTAHGPSYGAREVVVSAFTARTLWPGQNPLGRCLYLNGSQDCAMVVGVAEDARRFALVEERAMQVYTATDFTWHPYGALLVRTRGPADQRAPAVRRMLTMLGPALVDVRTFSLASIFAPNYTPYRAGAALLGAFSALALALAGAGLSGTVSYALAQRRREVGVRIALGARARHVGWLLARGGLEPATVGLMLGAAIALVGTHAARAVLYDVSPTDPGAALAAAVTVLGAASVACWVPARRAGRVPPADVLRTE